MISQDAEVEVRARAALNSFILRALRVESHSLATDRVALHRLSQLSITVQVNYTNGTATWIQECPPEEQVESAAARVRPLILNEDPTYYAKFFKAAGYFLKAAEAPEVVMKELRGLKQEWAEIQPKGQGVRGYYVEQSTVGSQQSHRATDNVLGFAWIYGDVVHHDADRLAQTRVFGVKERFRAAVPLVARIMVLTIATLNFARLLHREGLIPLDDGIFETPVIVTETTFRQEGQVYLGEVDSSETPMVLPPPGQAPGNSWKPVHEVFALAATEHTGPDQEVANSAQLHVQIVDPAGTVLAAVDLDRIESTQDTEGIRVVLAEANRVFRVEDRYDSATLSVERTLRLTDLAGQPAGVVLAALKFLTCCRTPNSARVSLRHASPAEGHIDPAWALDPPDEFRRELDALTMAVEALATIQRHTSVPIHVPDLSGAFSGEVNRWLFAARLLGDEEVSSKYPEGQCLWVGLGEEVDVPDDGTVGIELPLMVPVGGQRVELGTMVVWLSNATLVERRQSEGRIFHLLTTPDRSYCCRLADEKPAA
ncbi:hypothetical protein ACIG87_27400 [Micromonospora sp. NPDC051925]|uniref:hypothetical protein n=1 Tax=Micromonospora sp. NPDC051925 TaxID=3364288 RepID=UPI0037C4FB81